jgi:hypothetical protein
MFVKTFCGRQGLSIGTPLDPSPLLLDNFFKLFLFL